MPTATDLRDGMGEVAAEASATLADLWPTLKTADEARDALMDELPLLVDGYGAAAATLAADWYDESRAEAGVAGRFTAVPAAPELGSLPVLARWSVGPLYQATPDWESALTLAQGGLQKAVADTSRATVVGSTLRDKYTKGWRRGGSGDCDFCKMLILRGAVYKESTAAFSAHNHCHCFAVPDFGNGAPVPVKPFVPSRRRSTEASRARLRDYLRKQREETTGIVSKAGKARGASASAPAQALGFNHLTTAQVRNQIKVLESLRDTPYKTEQLARYRRRLKELSG